MTDELNQEGTIKLAPPFEFPLSENVVGRYGFKDAHVELRVKLPFPLSKLKKHYEASFTLEELKKLKEGVDKALMWAELEEGERGRMGA